MKDKRAERNFREPWLVVGAGGMLGQDLGDLVRESGKVVVALDLGEVDITRSDSVMEVVERYRPGLVINAAAFTDVDGCESRAEEAFAVNARGPENLGRACGATGAFLVQISTDYVFDGRKGGPYTEDDEPNPLGVYGRSKAEGDRLIRGILPDKHYIVRTQWLFGLHGRNFVEAILHQVQNKRPLKVVNDQFGQPTSTADFSAALMRLLSAGSPGTYHVTNSGITTWYGFACRILDYAGLSHVEVEAVETTAFPRPAPRPAYSVLDNSRFIRVTGAPLRPWESALRDYLDARVRMQSRDGHPSCP